MVNEASLTGESVPYEERGSVAYAGTVLEEGEITIRVKTVGGSSRYDKIVTMIEESEKLKSSLEEKAEHLADKLVPYTLGGTALAYPLTRNATKALAILMVDFSCALKLAMPISVLSVIREAGTHKATVKGGKYLEAMAEAYIIVFDKTGTRQRRSQPLWMWFLLTTMIRRRCCVSRMYGRAFPTLHGQGCCQCCQEEASGP